MKRVWMVIALLLLAFPAVAQDTMEATVVEIEADDGLALVGDYYAPSEENGLAPAVLLLHMLGSNRSAYEPLIPALLEEGYAVLTMDMRGHGDTGGSQDWDAALTDVGTMLGWLREQEGVDAEQVAIIGASIGSNVALLGCAADDQCVTVVALSPGLDYRGVQPEMALLEGLAERSALLVASHNDGYSADSVTQMFSSATGFVEARLYPGGAHGTQLFRNELDSISHLIRAWLAEQFARSET